jgi:predicted TIM-barrel enzyme
MPFIPRSESLRRLRSQYAAGRPIIGAGAGTGISAKFAERGGVDLIIIYNSGRFRMAGRGSASGMMPYGDANAIVADMAREVLPVVKDTPVLAGVCGTDPFRMMRVFLPELQRLGFDGVQNFPTVGLIDGQFRQILEETGMGIQLEIDMIAEAHRLGMLTCPYVFDEDTAARFTQAGADVVVAHVNTTVAGSIGVKSAVMPLDEAVARVQAMHDAAKAENPEVLVLCHGGPIAYPDDTQYVLERTRGVAGFFGASSIERLATEPAIEQQARKFKALKLRAD